MLIHIPTVVVTLIVGYAMLALQLSVTRQTRESPPLRLWNWGNWAMLLAFLFLIGRVAIPLALSVIGGNVFILVAMALYSQAIFLFLPGSATRTRGIWLGLCLGCVSIAALYPLDFAPRTSAYSVMQVAMLAPGVWHILRHGWNREPSLRTVALTMALCGVGLLARALHAWTDTPAFNEVAQAGQGPVIPFLIAFICMLGAGFGFLLAALERSATEMESLATHDGLTDCLNRNAALALLGNTLQRAQRTGESTSLVMLDLDHFKDVNDKYGHRTGDHVAEAVRAAIEAMVVSDLKDGTVSITVSAGVACATNGAVTTPDQLYHRADTALYAAKARGRNRIELATDL